MFNVIEKKCEQVMGSQPSALLVFDTENPSRPEFLSHNQNEEASFTEPELPPRVHASWLPIRVKVC